MRHCEMKKPSQELLQSILEDGVHWHVSLLRSLIEHDQRPGMAHERQMSDLRQTAWRRQKQRAHLHAKQALAQGKRLCEDRDSRKRTYSEMSATGQQILDDFDAKNLHKRVAETMCAVEKIPFRSSISFWDLGEPAMPEGALSQSPSASPQILDGPIPKACEVMDAGPKSIQILEAGRVMEAEGYVLQAHMERGYELEAMRQNAEFSWNRSLGQVEQPQKCQLSHVG